MENNISPKLEAVRELLETCELTWYESRADLTCVEFDADTYKFLIKEQYPSDWRSISRDAGIPTIYGGFVLEILVNRAGTVITVTWPGIYRNDIRQYEAVSALNNDSFPDTSYAITSFGAFTITHRCTCGYDFQDSLKSGFFMLIEDIAYRDADDEFSAIFGVSTQESQAILETLGNYLDFLFGDVLLKCPGDEEEDENEPGSSEKKEEAVGKEEGGDEDPDAHGCGFAIDRDDKGKDAGTTSRCHDPYSFIMSHLSGDDEEGPVDLT